jgi:AcrR family transcriptional regulator
MTTDASRPLRADAARNIERILRAAREVYAENGPDAQLEDIARHAGVGISTLYRHFPNKGELVRAALGQSIAEQIIPAIEQALGDDNPRRGLTTLIEAAMSQVASEHNTLAAAKNSDIITADLAAPFLESLTLLTHRAQEAGLIRADLAPEDMPRIMVMLLGVLWTMAPHSDGWRRYVALVLDALSPAGAGPLPPTVPLLREEQTSNWFI